MQIADQCVVSFHYTLTNTAGEQLDSSDGQDPLVYLHGNNGIIPGLERELAGKEAGDKLNVTVQPEDAYGPMVPELIQLAPHSAFDGIDEVKPGMQFEAQGPDGQSRIITVDKVAPEGVTINGNHPLAGQVLNFDVTVVEVRAATEQELEHGHAHD